MSNSDSTTPMLPPNPSGLCFCGCGRTTPLAKWTDKRIGNIKGEHTRCCAGHATAGTRGHNLQRAATYKVDLATGCWEWQGHINPAGYGRCRPYPKGRQVMAHRHIWEQENGPVPTGKELHHICRNRACVNPQHLELVEVRRHRSHGGKKLTFAMAQEIRRARAKGCSAAELAIIYGVAKTTVYHILSGKYWAAEIHGGASADA